MKIIETDNFDSDYPDEKFVNLPSLPAEKANAVCDIINEMYSGEQSRRFWQVVKDDYKLVGGFEP